MKVESNIYSFILSRHSIRSYKSTTLNLSDLQDLKKIINSTKSLFPENRFIVKIKNRNLEGNTVKILGAYGRVIISPHYLIPYLKGNKIPLVDLGFRVEQIAVRLWAAGIGSCFIGCISRQEEVRKILKLSKDTHIGAFLVFGYPDRRFGIQTLISLMKKVMGNERRKPVDQIFFLNSFDQPTQPPADWLEIVEAAKFAPSAVNAQPWRLLLHKNELYVFVIRTNCGYYLTSNRDYCFFDGGICMANIEMAASALKIKHQWHLFFNDSKLIPRHPDGLFPVAKFSISKIM